MFKKITVSLIIILLTIPTMMVLAQEEDDDPQCFAFESGSSAERTSYYMGEGAAFMRSGNFNAAIEAYTCVIDEVDSSFANAYYNRAVAYFARRQYEPAVEDYLAVIERDSQSYEAHNNLGVVYAAQGEFEDALDSFNRAVNIQADYLPTLINRGVILAINGDYEAAENEFLAIIEMENLDGIIETLQDPERDPEAPRPEFNPIALDAYALIGIIHSQRASEAYDDYLFLAGGRADSRVQSASGALDSRFQFDLRFDDGSWFLLAELADS